MLYLSHSQAVDYVSRVAGMSRETFDLNIRPRLIERKYSERVSRFSRVAIEKAIEDPSYSEQEGQGMFLKKKTVKDALEHTWALTWCSLKGAKTQRNLVDQLIFELGDVPLKKLDYNRLEEWVIKLRKKGLKPATIARRMTTLTKALGVAKAKGWIDTVPEKPVIEIGDNGRDRYLTYAEERALLDACAELGERGRIMALVLGFLLDTGCRLSELMKLRPHDLTDDGAIFRDRKNGSKLKVPLTARARSSADRLFRDDWWRHWTAKIHHADKDTRDTALKNLKDRLTHDFRLVRDKAKVLDVSLHVCRHTCLSRLVQAGMEITRVQQWAGHKQISQTMRYSHLAPTSLNAGKAILERHLQESDNVVDLDKRRISD